MPDNALDAAFSLLSSHPAPRIVYTSAITEDSFHESWVGDRLTVFLHPAHRASVDGYLGGGPDAGERRAVV